MNNLAQKIKFSRLYPVLWLEELISRRTRRILALIAQMLCLIFVLILARAYWRGEVVDLGWWWGWTILCLVGIVKHYLIECYFRSGYYDSIISNNYRAADLFTFTVGRILFSLRNGRSDPLVAFLNSRTGQRVLARLGIDTTAVDLFLKQHSTAGPELLLNGSAPLTLRQLVDWLNSTRPDFSRWLSQQQIRPSELIGATDWVVQEIETAAQAERWWSRERLSLVAGLAKDWAYGRTPTLDRYGEDLLLAAQATGFRRAISARRTESSQLATILLRSREANALLVAPTGESKLDLVWQLANEISRGRVPPPLEGRRPVLLRVALLLAAAKIQSEFEVLLLKILNEAERAGNLILVIDDLPTLFLAAERWGSNLAALLDPFLLSARLSVVALADIGRWHQVLENQNALIQRFELLTVNELDAGRLINIVETAASSLERQFDIRFTYQAVAAIIEAAEKYFQSEQVSDQALDLVTELAPWARSEGLPIIGRAEVLALVAQKTGIPLGPIGGGEREKLLHLEDHLREQVIGQAPALRGISQALRRERAGTRNDRRPIGSFLFLGPTGVGKTETAKALARSLFGREEALLRLDMSEYQSTEALNRLIGSFTEGQPGILANLLREHPYGILLLDEFEKTAPSVLNLFLQILDEGFFSDMLGRRVNARNLIIIATSNAGAELVWRMVEAGRDPAEARTELINNIIAQGIFRPELLNRFDEVIIFHPLTTTELQQVANLQLQRLAGRLQEQGITLVINDGLIQLVARAGADRAFGARPLARFIQEQVEQAVADQIVAGQLRPGDTVAFNQGRLTVMAS